MTLIPCVVAAMLILLVVYCVVAIVLCLTARCFQKGWLNRKSVLQVACDAVCAVFMPRHFVKIISFVGVRLVLFVLRVGLSFGLIVCLSGEVLRPHVGVTGSVMVALGVSLLIWYVLCGKRETRELLVLLRRFREGALLLGLCESFRFRTQLIAVVVGCVVAWFLYVELLAPVRLHFAGALLERRFDERLAMTEYGTKGILGHRGRSLSRSVMSKAICDDWRLQLFCGDIPVDWLLGEINDLEKHILENGDRARHCPAQRNVRWGVEDGVVDE